VEAIAMNDRENPTRPPIPVPADRETALREAVLAGRYPPFGDRAAWDAWVRPAPEKPKPTGPKRIHGLAELRAATCKSCGQPWGTGEVVKHEPPHPPGVVWCKCQVAASKMQRLARVHPALAEGVLDPGADVVLDRLLGSSAWVVASEAWTLGRMFRALYG
jgi:hypothetical protein